MGKLRINSASVGSLICLKLREPGIKTQVLSLSLLLVGKSNLQGLSY